MAFEIKLPLFYLNKSKNIFVSNLDLAENSVTERVFKLIKNKSYAYLWQYWDSTTEVEKHKIIFEKLSKYKKIDVTIMANTVEDCRVLSEIGFRAIHVHHNAFLDESLFRIIHNVPRQYNAIYITQYKPYKRIELARKINNLGIITFNNIESPTDVSYLKSLQGVGKIINPIRVLSPNEVCNNINLAKFGIILSKVEGGNYATTEYLLCGIPVITTDNIGGRNLFLNKNNSIFVPESEFEIGNIVNNTNNLIFNREHIRDNCIAIMGEFRTTLYNDLEARFGSDWDSEYKFVNKLLEWV